jgi:hypothetical protein
VTALVLIVTVVLVAFGILVWRRTHAPRALPHAPRGERVPTLFNLEVGDVVEHAGVDYFVESRLTYESEGMEWLAYMLVTGRGSEHDRWLSVEEDDRLEVHLFRTASPSAVPGALSGALPERVTFGDHTYALEERGSATVRRQKRSGAIETLACTYADYTAPGGHVLCVEQWGGAVEVLVGQAVLPKALTLMPGNGRPLLSSGTDSL